MYRTFNQQEKISVTLLFTDRKNRLKAVLLDNLEKKSLYSTKYFIFNIFFKIKCMRQIKRLTF